MSRRRLMVLGVALLLTACGRKGPLELPEPTPARPESAPPPTSDAEGEAP